MSTLRRQVSTKAAPSTSATARELGDAVSQLRRSIRRRARRDWPHAPLAGNELELVRLLLERSDIRVQDAAAALGLADNTVSTLVGRLSAQGLIERRTDPHDGRAALLTLSPAARRRVADWRDRRSQMIAAAIEGLPATERAALSAAIPALRSLRERLEADS
jgi:DNA-binding MarR family transcriptional regulator